MIQRVRSVIPVELEVALSQTFHQTFVVEVPAIPGVLAERLRANDALRSVVALALRIIADRVDLGELNVCNLAFSFSVNVPGRLLLGITDIPAAVQADVGSELLENMAEEFAPIPDFLGDMSDILAESLGQQRPQARRAKDVFGLLIANGWKQDR